MGVRTNCVNKEDNDKRRKGNYLKDKFYYQMYGILNEFAELKFSLDSTGGGW